MATLLMIAVITGAAVAFFQSTRIERFVARNYADLARAQLAAESGYSLAAGLIRIGSTNDHFLVVQNTNRQLFLGNGTNQTTLATFAYLPLFSFTTNLTSYSTNSNSVVTTPNMPGMSVSGGTVFTNTLPGGLVVTSPAVRWVVLTNSAGRTNARFAFWVEDLSGRLDLSVSGSAGTNINSAGSVIVRRPSGTDPRELALWSLFNPGTNLDSDNAVVRSLTNASRAILTPATARLVNSSAITTNLLADLAAGLIHDTSEPQIVPFGFGYPSNGQPKLNLNQWVLQGNSGIARIGDMIAVNLPGFTNRAGAMPGSVYFSNLAANIVDFADADSTPSAEPATAFPSWRGVEAIPWPNEYFTRFRLQSRTLVGNNYEFKLEVKQYLEVWNLCNKDVSIPANSMSISNNMNIAVQSTNWFGNLATADPANPPSVQVFTNAAVNLPPNSYAILATPPILYTINVPTNLVPNTTTPMLTINRLQTPPNSNNRYVTFLNNIPVDATRAGRYLGTTTNLRVNDYHFICTSSSFGTSSGTSVYNLACGDPRAQLFVSLPAMAIGYDTSTPGGRNRYTNASGGANTVDPAVNWPDLGYSLGNSGADIVASPTSPNANANLPMGLQRAGNTNHWIQFFGNSGSFSNIADLGYIFDPIQWGDPNNPFHPRDSAAWMSLSSSCVPFAGAGGRNTLRIGRAEHFRFNSNGVRASQLLDVFAAGDRTANNGQTVLNNVAGRINLNTATTNTLRALAAGVVHEKDPALTPGGTNFTVPVAAVSAFVSGVTNFRNQRPFFSPAELTSITNGNAPYPNNAVFGNINLLGVTRGGDTASEEWFSKVFPMASVRSRNFLIHVVAQTMTTNTNFPARPLAVSRQSFQVYAQPLRNAAGLTTNVIVQKIGSWSF